MNRPDPWILDEPPQSLVARYSRKDDRHILGINKYLKLMPVVSEISQQAALQPCVIRAGLLLEFLDKCGLIT